MTSDGTVSRADQHRRPLLIMSKHMPPAERNRLPQIVWTVLERVRHATGRFDDRKRGYLLSTTRPRSRDTEQFSAGRHLVRVKDRRPRRLGMIQTRRAERPGSRIGHTI